MKIKATPLYRVCIIDNDDLETQYGFESREKGEDFKRNCDHGCVKQIKILDSSSSHVPDNS